MTDYPSLLRCIVNAPIWQEPLATRAIFITLICLANRETGEVECTVRSLTKQANVGKREAIEALRYLSSPDKREEDQRNKGIKIKRTLRGWIILDYSKAKREITRDELRAYNRRTVREWRHRTKYGLITPKDPALADAEDEKIRAHYLPSSPQAKRLSGIMHRQLTTCWTPAEITAFTEIWRIEDEDILFLEEYYRFWKAHGPRKDGSIVIKTSLLALLRNYDSEVEKAKQFVPRYKIDEKIKRVNGIQHVEKDLLHCASDDIINRQATQDDTLTGESVN